jgi:hypothetical protein
MAGCNSQFEKFLTKLMAEVREGIRHGFFDYRLRGEVVNGRKRQLILEAGKKYKFTIPQEELDQQSADDPD